MHNYKISARVTLYGTRAIFVITLLLMSCFPVLLEQYHIYLRPMSSRERTALLVGFYGGCVGVLPALWSMDKLLRNILAGQPFTMENVNCVRFIRWCCLAVSISCLGASFGYRALFFLSLVMAFLFLVVTVVGQVLKAAVAIREENDLTV